MPARGDGRRLPAAWALATSYGVNDLGHRVTKSGAGGQTEYLYDLSGHLIGTYDGNGDVREEIVWLGDLPVATLQGGAAYYIMPDHLGAPHEIVNSANGQVWFWDHGPYGNGAPSAAAGFSHDLRFPGQIYDAETRLHNNGFRDYDPRLGRYVESDPIGLAGGVNTYAYAGNDPVNVIDPMELDPQQKKECRGLIPTHPPGVDVDANMREAARMWPNAFAFRDAVRNKGRWDYKQQGRQYQNFGNFNYGAAGHAFGWPFTDTFLLKKAGEAQIAAGTSKPEWQPEGGTKPPYGDDPEDQTWIQRGIDYARDGGKNGSACK